MTHEGLPDKTKGLAGTGRLADIIGLEAATDFFDDMDDAKRTLRTLTARPFPVDMFSTALLARPHRIMEDEAIV